jgi:hypothetical protein
MRIILSRKGFDSGVKAGRVASPILDGKLVSLPIPGGPGEITYDDLHFERHSLGKIVEDLTRRRLKRTHAVHLDPDLRRAARNRATGWRAIFGQGGAAEAHLRNYGVTVGDLFLFFGWFREAELHDGSYRYKRGAPNLHILYGWLQVGAVLTFPERHFAKIPWAEYHPHFYGAFGTVYLASDHLCTRGRSYDLPAAGVFRRYSDSLRLTSPNSNGRGIWQLPKWFYPRNNESPLSYHPNITAFEKHRDYTILHSAARGQEFILDTTEYPEAIKWARRLITTAT